MKKSVITLFLALRIIDFDSQVVLQENFKKYFSPSANGWIVKNLSQNPNHGNTWVQGFSAFFSAYNGGPDDYFASSFLATSANTPGTISAWLLTPTITLINGSVLEFVSRTVANPATYADRLEVYMSTAGTGTDVGTSHTSVGTFSTLLISINPSLTSTGYPDVWTVFSATISGLSAHEVGRIGFRYHVTDGGGSQQATNSEFIGIDAVRYTLPCVATVGSYTTCAGQTLTVVADSAVTGANFTWTPGGMGSSSVIITPTATSVYTLNYEVSGLVCPALTSTITVGSNLNINVAASSSSFCEGGAAVLSATGAASSYTWVNSNSNNKVITVNPASTTIYTVTGSSGSLPGNYCTGSSTVLITVHPNPVVVASVSRTFACTNETVLVSASGADTYTWTGTFAAFDPAFIFKAGFSTGGKTFFVTGASVHGCTNTTGTMVKVDNCNDVVEVKFSEKSLLAYPQPFAGVLTIKSEPGTIKLFNILGEEIFIKETTGEISVDTSSLPGGSYSVVLLSTSNGKVRTLNAFKVERN